MDQQWGQLDILINNAGVVSAGPLEQISDEDIIAQQNIDTTGLILLTKHALGLLKQSREAAIMNVSSGLGLIAMPFYAPYAATKAAVRQFSESVRRELKKGRLSITTTSISIQFYNLIMLPRPLHPIADHLRNRRFWNTT